MTPTTERPVHATRTPDLARRKSGFDASRIDLYRHHQCLQHYSAAPRQALQDETGAAHRHYVVTLTMQTVKINPTQCADDQIGKLNDAPHPSGRQPERRSTLAEIIQAFHADALSSAVNLNADLDIMLCVLAQALIAALRARLPGYASVTPDVLQRRFLETPGQITTSRDTITVRLDRRAYSPVLRQADLPHNTRVPWWDNRTLRFEFS